MPAPPAHGGVVGVRYLDVSAPAVADDHAEPVRGERFRLAEVAVSSCGTDPPKHISGERIPGILLDRRDGDRPAEAPLLLKGAADRYALLAGTVQDLEGSGSGLLGLGAQPFVAGPGEPHSGFLPVRLGR